MKSYWIGLTILAVACATLEIRQELDQSVLNLVGYLDDSKPSQNEMLTSILEYAQTADLNEYKIGTINCTNSTLRVCGSKRGNNYLFIWYQGIQIPYRGEFQNESIVTWCKRIANTHFTIINSVDHLKELVEKNRFVYVYFNKDERNQEEVDAMEKASKYFHTFTFGVVFDKEVREALAQKGGNFTVYKYPFDLENKNDMNSRHNSWDGLQSFILTWCYPEINLVSDQGELSRRRFHSDTKEEFVALMCDDSHYCLYNVIPKYYELYLANEKTYRFQVRLHHMVLRESHMLKIYFNMKADKYPAMAYVNLENDNLQVYSESQGDDKADPALWMKSFMDQAQQRSFTYDYLSEPIPKNNGLGNGKGIEKQIQQFVYDSLEKTLKENPKKWYLVLFTILGSGCDNCETFYKEFKKIRSFTLEEEYGNNLVLGRYEFMRNIILEPAVDNIPDLILYRPADEDGKREAVRFEKHTDYDNVMTWLNDQLNRSSSEQEL